MRVAPTARSTVTRPALHKQHGNFVIHCIQLQHVQLHPNKLTSCCSCTPSRGQCMLTCSKVYDLMRLQKISEDFHDYCTGSAMNGPAAQQGTPHVREVCPVAMPGRDLHAPSNSTTGQRSKRRRTRRGGPWCPACTRCRSRTKPPGCRWASSRPHWRRTYWQTGTRRSPADGKD